jgi:DNA-binding transcriptional ArsR family regulator
VDKAKIKMKFAALTPHLDERMRRIIVASETLGADYGAISEVSRATGVSRRAISQVLGPVGERLGAVSIRREGGGRRKTVDIDPALRVDLEQLIEPTTRGDPESPFVVDLPARAFVHCWKS